MFLRGKKKRYGNDKKGEKKKKNFVIETRGIFEAPRHATFSLRGSQNEIPKGTLLNGAKIFLFIRLVWL